MGLGFLFEKLMTLLIQTGMPVVFCYHLVIGNIFFNTAAQDAEGLEELSNEIFVPIHYLFAGRAAVKDDSEKLCYRLEQRFNYQEHFILYTSLSIAAAPTSLLAGSVVKALSYLSEKTRMRYRAIEMAIAAVPHASPEEKYLMLGVDPRDFHHSNRILSPHFSRRPGDENHLQAEKKALRDILKALHEHRVLCWVDCGTCLGAYRYEGVIPWDNDIDLAILQIDFENARRALNTLDKKKYHIQDWSGRTRPQSYLKVYVKEAAALIDIYHFAIDPVKKEIRSILSNEDSIFLPESWKIRERRYTIPVSLETVFPLKKALLDGIEVPVPAHTKEYLQSRYGENIDPVKLFSESTGSYEKDLSHPYWQLSHVK
ncbi:MAG: LicD family protein [Anaerolineae bacterium]